MKSDKFNLNQCRKNDLEREQIENILYAFIIGSMMYVQVFTRPHIAFAIEILGKY